MIGYRIRQDFGVEIKRLMQVNGMGQGDLARKTEIPAINISRMIDDERNPRWDMLDRIAGALGVPVQHFATGGREQGEVDPDIKDFYAYDFHCLPNQLKTWHKSTLDLLREAADNQKAAN